MSKFRCIVKYGHAGSGKYTERSYYVWATDLLDAMSKVKTFSGVKKGNLFRTGGSVLQVERVN
jgi:hypothetical protein